MTKNAQFSFFTLSPPPPAPNKLAGKRKRKGIRLQMSALLFDTSSGSRTPLFFICDFSRLKQSNKTIYRQTLSDIAYYASFIHFCSSSVCKRLEFLLKQRKIFLGQRSNQLRGPPSWLEGGRNVSNEIKLSGFIHFGCFYFVFFQILFKDQVVKTQKIFIVEIQNYLTVSTSQKQMKILTLCNFSSTGTGT